MPTTVKSPLKIINGYFSLLADVVVARLQKALTAK